MSSRTLPIVSSLLARKSIARTTATAMAHGWSGTSSVVPSIHRSVPIPLHTEWIPPEACESRIDKANNTDEHYTVLFLHGLLGSGRNLKTFARKVVQQQSSNQGSCRGGILVDLRGHGTSFRTQKREEHSLGKDQANEKYGTACTFSDCARDIEHTLQQTLRADENENANGNENESGSSQPSLQPPPPPARVLVGHSFGGRLALEYAAGVAETQPLKALWLLDTVPGEANETVDRVLATIANVLEDNKNNRSNDIDSDNDSTTPPPTKKEIVSVLTEPPHGMDPPTAQWLAMSYDEKSGDNFGFDNDLVTRLKPEFRDQDFHGLLRKVLAATETKNKTKTKNKTQVHVVRGGKNTGWSIPILSELEAVRREFPTNFHLHVLPSTGHNVHIDDLQGLVKLFEGR
mmetsp:Transcript_25541/g.70305  ORF Transcript_25541/g.70305 Transcript_25541/m.70305 type:complete len:403 (+) Transcript_25541:129-1337(+)